MILKKFKPTTSSKRHFISSKLQVSKKSLLKFKIKGKKNSSGRNYSGKITVYHKGNGHKKKYRKLYSKEQLNCIGIICSIEYDPFRNSSISAVYNIFLKKYFYIISPLDIKIGDIVKTGIYGEAKLGHILVINKIPVGSFIYNISITKMSKKNQFSKSAGTYSCIVEKKNNYCIIKLSSGKFYIISTTGTASIGIVSNKYFFLTTIGKAGRNRWLNKRPKVRGVAMNPIDHPHGGGEGKTSGGRTSVSPWGKPTKN